MLMLSLLIHLCYYLKINVKKELMIFDPCGIFEPPQVDLDRFHYLKPTI